MSIAYRAMILSVLIMLTSGCASAVKRVAAVQAIVNQAVDCESAQHSIDQLLSQKTSMHERAVNTIASVLPSSILLNIITGEFTSRSSIAAGKLDRQITDKISAIEHDCMLVAVHAAL